MEISMKKLIVLILVCALLFPSCSKSSKSDSDVTGGIGGRNFSRLVNLEYTLESSAGTRRGSILVPEGTTPQAAISKEKKCRAGVNGNVICKECKAGVNGNEICREIEYGNLELYYELKKDELEKPYYNAGTIEIECRPINGICSNAYLKGIAEKSEEEKRREKEEEKRREKEEEKRREKEEEKRREKEEEKRREKEEEKRREKEEKKRREREEKEKNLDADLERTANDMNNYTRTPRGALVYALENAVRSLKEEPLFYKKYMEYITKGEKSNVAVKKVFDDMKKQSLVTPSLSDKFRKFQDAREDLDYRDDPSKDIANHRLFKAYEEAKKDRDSFLKDSN